MTGSGPQATSLAAAVQAGVAGAGIPRLAAAVQRLMSAYRSGEVPAAPVMSSGIDAAAYAAYRMPATAAATAAALREMQRSLDGWRPASLLDFGAGTGGAAWAAATELPGLESLTLLEQSADAIRLGQAILARCRVGSAAIGDLAAMAAAGQRSGPPFSPGTRAELATAAYVLGELPPGLQTVLVSLAAQAAPAVLLVEPGTPAGHRRILAAREQLLAAGIPHCRAVPASARLPARRAGGLVPLRRAAAALGGAPSGQGRGAGVRGREVQLRGRRPAAGRAAAAGWPGRAAAAAAQGPGHAGSVRQ